MVFLTMEYCSPWLTWVHRWASISAFMLAISDINISYYDIGTKYVGLNPFIPISEEFQYRHQLPFRYRTKNQYRIFRYLKLINQSQMTRINFYTTQLFTLVSNSQYSCQVSGILPLRYEDLHFLKSDIGYWRKVYSDI